MPTGVYQRRPSTLVEITNRFWAKVEKTQTCWLWTAAMNQYGYGTFEKDGHTCLVHRVAYEWEKGSIPDGLEIDHLCQVHSCVNAHHLEAVTKLVNMQRGKQACKTHCIHGHPLSGNNLRMRPHGRRGCRACHRIEDRASYYRRKYANSR